MTDKKDNETPRIDEAKIKRVMEKGTKKISEKDVERVVEKKEEFEKKLKSVPGKLGKMVNQLKLLFELIAAYWNGGYREIPFISIAAAAFAVAYFVSPIDLIPDFIPVVGYMDDAAVIALTMLAIHEDLRTFCQFKGYDLAKYFD